MSWHMKRIQISFSKGKYKKVKKLAVHNQELEEILGYSERVIPISKARSSSNLLTLSEKTQRLACGIYNALQRHWKCSGSDCSVHQAHLNLRPEMTVPKLNIVFSLNGGQGQSAKPSKQEVIIQEVKDDKAAHPTTAPVIGHVQRATSLTNLQQQFEMMEPTKSRLSVSKIFTRSSSSINGISKTVAKHEKQVRFASPELDRPSQPQEPQVTSDSHIYDLCSTLKNCDGLCYGVITDESNRRFQILKPSQPGLAVSAPEDARLTLSQVLDAHHFATMNLNRRLRFEIALHISYTLLHIQMSPWLPGKWSKHDLHFLADANALYSDYPYVCKSFVLGARGN